jgi:hypothetical protein
MTLRSATKTLLVLVLALPIVQAVLVWVRALLNALGDEASAAIVGRFGMACLVVWSLSVVGLVIVLAVSALNATPPDDEKQE